MRILLLGGTGAMGRHLTQILASSQNEISVTSRKIRDNLKKKFCLENKIPLIEIPYYDYDKIDTEYLRRVMNL